MIAHRESTGALRAAAIEEGMHTLRQSARRLVLDGTTSIVEMMRISVENGVSSISASTEENR